MPDGHVDLIWMRGKLRVAGPDRVGVVEHLPAGETVHGLRFRAGAARQWLGVPMDELVGARVAIEDLWGARGRALQRRLSGSDDPAMLLRRELAERALATPHGAPVLARIFAGARDVDMSPRTLRAAATTPLATARKCSSGFVAFNGF